MNKKITQARLIKVLDKIDEAIEQIYLPYQSIILAAMNEKIDALVYGQWEPKPEIDQSLKRFSINPERLKSMMKESFIRSDRLNRKKAKIRALQHRYRISGLISKDIQIQGNCYTYPKKHPDLDLMDYDALALQQSKHFLCEIWFSVAQTQKLNTFFMLPGGAIKQVELKEIQASLGFYDAAELLENSEPECPCLYLFLSSLDKSDTPTATFIATTD